MFSELWPWRVLSSRSSGFLAATATCNLCIWPQTIDVHLPEGSRCRIGPGGLIWFGLISPRQMTLLCLLYSYVDMQVEIRMQICWVGRSTDISQVRCKSFNHATFALKQLWVQPQIKWYDGLMCKFGLIWYPSIQMYIDTQICWNTSRNPNANQLSWAINWYLPSQVQEL